MGISHNEFNNNKISSFEELKIRRKQFLIAATQNDFSDGIKKLLSDLYPDTAHFIYELLQNAEDMNATIVRFTLNPTCLYFEHNGTKRDFILQDVEAITGISNNTPKRNDETSIGKFGVGFKSVYAYTSTPIIHSGKFHFKITDYFVPDDNVEYVETFDPKTKTSWTKFEFPFNNPKKPIERAYSEILSGLEQLDETSILFLKNITTIEYILPNSEIGYVKLTKNKENPNHVLIEIKNPKRKDSLNFLRFNKNTTIKEESGAIKNLPIFVAYKAKYKKEKLLSIEPINDGGKVFIYFPAEKERSGLRFYINAPFASTVARESVLDRPQNRELLNKVANLVVETIEYVKRNKMLNESFLSTLPNHNDYISPFYKPIYDKIIQAFENNEYLPTPENEYASAKSALVGEMYFKPVFNSQPDFDILFHGTKKWLYNYNHESRAYYFIESLPIQKFSNDFFFNLFTIRNREILNQCLSNHTNDIDWFINFYKACSKSISNARNYDVCKNMKESKMFLSTKKKLCYIVVVK